MSDFASLLKGFEATAKQAASADAPKPTAAPTRKRQRTTTSNSTTDEENEHHPFPPRDISQLSVTVDFMCIGAQKAGTTWLYEMLRKIPQLGLPDKKEVHFWDWHRRKGLSWYSRQFPSSKRDVNVILGEITPCYMTLPAKHVQEIHGLFPNLRIIFLARDLVDRAYSAMTMELRQNARGLQAGEFDVPYDQMHPKERERLQRESDPQTYQDEYFLQRLIHKTHADRSNYAAGLERWLAYFPPKQILILHYQDIADHPKELLENILNHVQVSNATVPDKDELSRRVNTAMTSHQPIRPTLRQKMETHLRPHAISFNALLQKHYPKIVWRLDEYGPDKAAAFQHSR